MTTRPKGHFLCGFYPCGNQSERRCPKGTRRATVQDGGNPRASALLRDVNTTAGQPCIDSSRHARCPRGGHPTSQQHIFQAGMVASATWDTGGYPACRLSGPRTRRDTGRCVRPRHSSRCLVISSVTRRTEATSRGRAPRCVRRSLAANDILFRPSLNEPCRSLV